MTHNPSPSTSATEWTPERIKGLRARLGLTHAELAKRCGVATSSAQCWVLPETSARRKQPSGPVKVILEQLEAEARRRNPLGIELIDPAQPGPKRGVARDGTV